MQYRARFSTIFLQRATGASRRRPSFLPNSSLMVVVETRFRWEREIRAEKVLDGLSAKPNNASGSLNPVSVKLSSFRGSISSVRGSISSVRGNLSSVQ